MAQRSSTTLKHLKVIRDMLKVCPTTKVVLTSTSDLTPAFTRELQKLREEFPKAQIIWRRA